MEKISDEQIQRAKDDRDVTIDWDAGELSVFLMADCRVLSFGNVRLPPVLMSEVQRMSELGLVLYLDTNGVLHLYRIDS